MTNGIENKHAKVSRAASRVEFSCILMPPACRELANYLPQIKTRLLPCLFKKKKEEKWAWPAMEIEKKKRPTKYYL